MRTWTQINHSGLRRLVRLRLFHRKRRNLRQLHSKLLREGSRHVQHEKYRAGEILRQPSYHPHHRSGPAGRSSDYDDWEFASILRGDC